VALRRRGFVSVGAAVACCALAAGCTSDPVPASTPSPTPVATTPAESQIERQMRLDYEAAEKAYQSALAERERQGALGVAKSTPVLKASATGAYLDLVLKALICARQTLALKRIYPSSRRSPEWMAGAVCPVDCL